MFNIPGKYVMIDGFRIPANQADEYVKLRDRMEKEARKFFSTFCEEVRKQPLIDLVGQGIVGYDDKGNLLARISLDPFELSAMKVAAQRHKLNKYMLATNGYVESDYQILLKQFKQRHSQVNSSEEKKSEKNNNKEGNKKK